jgi:hypothetical protein
MSKVVPHLDELLERLPENSVTRVFVAAFDQSDVECVRSTLKVIVDALLKANREKQSANT